MFAADKFPTFTKGPEDVIMTDDSDPNLRNHYDWKKTFNPMGGLTLVPFAHVAQNFFTRGAPFIIPVEALILFLPFFFLLAALTAGSAIPSGLLLPQIIIGALIGRLITLIVIVVQLHSGWYPTPAHT